MFKTVVVSLFALALNRMAFPAPAVQEDLSQFQVVRFESNSNRTGIYSVTYELSNGIIYSESGALDGKQIVEGSYSFVGPDNETYMISYYVDEDGFHPMIGSGTGVNQGVLKSLVG